MLRSECVSRIHCYPKRLYSLVLGRPIRTWCVIISMVLNVVVECTRVDPILRLNLFNYTVSNIDVSIDGYLLIIGDRLETVVTYD